ncbi:MAG: GGDEF domain-containing protein [Schwartzia sp.]|nr:GGDEF domain-containing protein [Schwartzia sp. (in: firmicutes)]
MNFSKLRRGYIAFMALYVIVYGTILYRNIEPFTDYTNTIELMADLVNLAVVTFVARSRPPGLRMPWVWFGVAILLYTLGDAYLVSQTDFQGLEPESPNPADWCFILNNIACFAGLGAYLRQTEHIRLMETAFDILLSVMAAAGLIFQFLVRPLLVANEGANTAELFIQLFYPVADIGFLSGCFLLVFGTDIRRFFTRPNLMLIVTFLFMFVIDQLSLIGTVYEIEVIETFLGPCWAPSFFLLTLAGTFPAEERIELHESHVSHRWETLLVYGRILLPYLFAFALLIMAAVLYNLWDSFFIGAIVMVLLLSLRQINVLLRNQGLLKEIQKSEQELFLKNQRLEKMKNQMERDAKIDFLTQLANRRHIDQTFVGLIPEEGKHLSLGVLLIDVDFFKRINDTYGHQIGDEVLQTVARTIRSVIRDSDIAGRFGGDEFILLMPGAQVKDTAAIAERLLQKIRDDKELADRQVTLSIGCTSRQFSREDYSVIQIMKQADDALYRAKENGRNRYEVYDPEAAETA